MPEDKDRGWYHKYDVKRVDGKPIKDGCIVLEFDDENARYGIEAWAAQCEHAGYKQLAKDVRNKLATYHTNVKPTWDGHTEEENYKHFGQL